MFYKQFLEITDGLNADVVKEFDFWLATLPEKEAKSITISTVASRLGIQYSIADLLLEFALRKGILKRAYMLVCPNEECHLPHSILDANEVRNMLGKEEYCHNCQEEFVVDLTCIINIYQRNKKPDVSDRIIRDEIIKRLGFGKDGFENEINFNIADSLGANKKEVYNLYYAPDESAYKRFKIMKDKLDWNYGKDTTAQGKALEILALDIFNQIQGVRCTNDAKTKTNQFDCTCLCGIKTIFPSVFSYLAPYFLIECKNEPKKKPNNTYCNKLLSIMDTNEAQVGIVFGRINATEPCFVISREHYLKHSESRRQQIILTFSDDDWNCLIDNKVNLLAYLEYKIFQITSNSPDASYEMFIKK